MRSCSLLWRFQASRSPILSPSYSLSKKYPKQRKSIGIESSQNGKKNEALSTTGWLQGQQIVDVRGQIKRHISVGVSTIRDTILVNQNFFKVPSSISSCNWRPRDQLNIVHNVTLGDPRTILSHPGPDRIGVISIYIRFLEQGEICHKTISRSDIVKTVENFSIWTWFLIFKLTAWEAKDFEFTSVVECSKGVIGGVLNWGISSEACDICE